MNAWPIDLAAVLSGFWPMDAGRWGAEPLARPGSVWIHGASLGETRIARSLASALQRSTFVTTDTAAGRTFADAFRPIDHPWSLAASWSAVRPALLVFVESAWYPALVRLAKRDGVPVISVASDPSALGLKHRVLGGPDAVFAKTRGARQRFAALGVPVLGVCGSMKSHAAPPNPLEWRRPFLVALSAREGDTERLLQARDECFPDHVILTAPRRPSDVARWVAQGFVRRSQARCIEADIVVDTHGELGALTRGARAALVGGTFDARIGGHSPMDAVMAGVPFATGPHTWGNSEDLALGEPIGSEGLGPALLRARPAPIPEDRTASVARVLEDLACVGPERSPRPWAAGLSVGQRVGMAIRRCRTAPTIDKPVVAVGSNNARGSGKTSTALWVALQLRRRGHQVGIVTRGVGRVARVAIASHLPDVRLLGDEGALFALRGFYVAAGADRREAARLLDDCTVIVMEDGLQTATLRADLRIESVDARFPTGRGTLPAGEGRGLFAPSHVRVVHHGSPDFCAPGLAVVRRPSPFNRVPVGTLAAFCGIARPADFFAEIDAARVRTFPNHHTYSRKDMESLRTWGAGATLVTTDRDAVRFPSLWRDSVGLCWRGIELSIPDFPLERLP